MKSTSSRVTGGSESGEDGWARLDAADLAFTPVVGGGAVEQVVLRLGRAIGSGVLPPGGRLPSEPVLAASLGVAVTTLRQALAVMREAGYLETRRGRGGGSFVATDAEQVLAAFTRGARSVGEPALRALTDWRRAVGGEAAALAARRRTDRDLAVLRDHAAAVAAALGDFPAFRIADARFHVAVAEAARSPRLLEAETALQVELNEVLQSVMGPVVADRRSHDEHEALLSAIERGDGDAAREVAVRHVEGTYDDVVGLLLGRLPGSPGARSRPSTWAVSPPGRDSSRRSSKPSRR
jgi:DNA-binding FadR family transcriptional regulator